MQSGPGVEDSEHFVTPARLISGESSAICKGVEDGAEGPTRLRRKKMVE